MLFNSYEFLIFLPLALLVYWSCHRRLRLQNLVLVGSGYIFYAWWDLRFLLLIVLMTAVGYVSGLGIERYRQEGRKARLVLTGCVLFSLGVLGVFKYYDFFAGSLQEALSRSGLPLSLPLLHLVLPVGISFYTFQILSYAVDVRRGKIRACRDLVSFAAFVCFFPQLVAGPIERAGDLLPQMQHRRRVRYAEVVDGLRLMLWGFFKKMLIADRCAPIVQAIYSNPQADGTDLWMGTILFAFQIYGDFSGYSDIAIGTARLFGIKLTRNFNLPYFSCSVAEFWRRWHITLMSWFKDYLYIPLGGSRKGRLRHILNVTAVFLVSGLWHGANWTFVAWGAYQAAWFVPLSLLKKQKGEQERTAEKATKFLPSAYALLQMCATFVIICVGWVFFRSEDVGSACSRIGRMFTDVTLHSPYGGLSPLLPAGLMLLVEWTERERRHSLDFACHGLLRYRAVRWCIYYALIFSILYWGGNQTAFIYFQF